MTSISRTGTAIYVHTLLQARASVIAILQNSYNQLIRTFEHAFANQELVTTEEDAKQAA